MSLSAKSHQKATLTTLNKVSWGTCRAVVAEKIRLSFKDFSKIRFTILSVIYIYLPFSQKEENKSIFSYVTAISLPYSFLSYIFYLLSIDRSKKTCYISNRFLRTKNISKYRGTEEIPGSKSRRDYPNKLSRW